MGSCEKQYNGVFTPPMIEVINRAYRSALDVLETRPLLKQGMRDQDARVELAKTMIALAQAGERDEKSLRERALFRLSVMAGGVSEAA